MEPLQYVMDLPATRDRVWEMWTTAVGLCSWLCLRAEVEPKVGGPFELFFNPDESKPASDSTLGCKVLSVDRPRLLVFDWRGADELAEVMNAPGTPRTRCQVELLPRPTGTRLRVTHSGWGDGPGWEEARAWFDRAWSGALERLLVGLDLTLSP